MLDLRYTKKEDLEKIIPIRTILRKLSLDYKTVYSEFRTYGWENYKHGKTKSKTQT